MSEYLYLYGFVPADSPVPTELTGINDARVELIPLGSLQAVVSMVPAGLYAADVVESKLQDLQWVGQQGVAHERVVAWFVDHGQILPASLLTLYSSRQALQQAYEEQHPELYANMERLRGLREWDLKISCDENMVIQHAAHLSERVARLDAEIAAASPGKRYLLEKKRTDMVRSEARQAAQARALSVLDRARPLAVEVRNLPLPRGAESLPVVLHAALLVRNDQEAALIANVAEQAAALREIGMELSFSGPWAPYRFIGQHES